MLEESLSKVVSAERMMTGPRSLVAEDAKNRSRCGLPV